MRGTYFRWTETDAGTLRADILGSRFDIEADPQTGRTVLTITPDGGEPATVSMDADEARMIGVRLIEGATRADANRSVREA